MGRSNCTVIGDRGYISAQEQLDLFETANIRLEVHTELTRKSGSRHFRLLPKREKELKPYFRNCVTSL